MNLLRVFIIAGVLNACHAYIAQAQNFRYSVPGLDTLETGFIVQGTAANVLRSGQAEIISNNSLNSYQIALHANGDNSPVLDRLRSTLFTADLFAYYGVSTTGKFDLGVQVKYARSRLDNAAASSPFKVFSGDTKTEVADPLFQPSGSTDQTFSGLASAGLRFRYKPFNTVPSLIINGGYALATVKDSIAQRQLTADRDVADIGLTFYQTVTDQFMFFFTGQALAYIPSSVRDEALYTTSLSLYLVGRTNNKKWLFYPGLSYGLSFKPSEFDDNALIKTTNSLFAIGGVQYAPNSRVNLFATVGFPLQIDLINPLVEIIRPSYSLFGLGFRVAVL